MRLNGLLSKVIVIVVIVLVVVWEDGYSKGQTRISAIPLNYSAYRGWTGYGKVKLFTLASFLITSRINCD